MTTWIIEPIDPLIVRDGRPFGPTPGVRAASLSFPFPSTVAGAVRTRYGLSQNKDFNDPDPQKKADLIRTVKDIAIKGPFLVQLKQDSGDVEQWFAPAPSDALLLDLAQADASAAVVRQLLPRALPDGAHTNLPDGLFPVCLVPPDARKPCDRAPRFWRWEKFEKWLLAPSGEDAVLSDLGCNGPIVEKRTHVSVQPGTWTAAEGALFQTSGLEFSNTASAGLSSVKRLALGFKTSASGIQPGIGSLGGEQRLVSWRKSASVLPQCPGGICESIADTGACRLVLITPAHFNAGFRPAWLTTTAAEHGVTASLQSVAAPRAQVISGWDFEIGKPKPTRRLAPAGAVFFLKLDGKRDAIREWASRIWMQSVSDGEQNRRDGFGLAVCGTWSGETPTLEVTV